MAVTEVVHEHHDHTDNGNSMSLVIGAIVLFAIIALLFFLFQGGMRLGNFFGAPQTAPQIQVPEKVDVNVNK